MGKASELKIENKALRDAFDLLLQELDQKAAESKGSYDALDDKDSLEAAVYLRERYLCEQIAERVENLSGSPMHTKSVERRLSVQWQAKAERLEGELAAAWADAAKRYQPEVDCADTAVELFGSYSKDGGLTYSETLHEVAKEIRSLSHGLAEQIDKAEKARVELAAAEERLEETRSLLWEADDLLGQMFSGEPEILQLHENIHAVSSAPKRGRVVCQLEGRWIADKSLPKRFDLVLRSTTYDGKTADEQRRICVGTTSPDLPDEGQAVVVTVREQAPKELNP